MCGHAANGTRYSGFRVSCPDCTLHATVTRDYSIRTAESHMKFNGVQHVRICHSNTAIT